MGTHSGISPAASIVRAILFATSNICPKNLASRWPLDDNVTNKDIAKLFHPDLYGAAIPHKEPDYAYMHTELARKGVNLTLLWSEYCAECYANGDNP